MMKFIKKDIPTINLATSIMLIVIAFMHNIIMNTEFYKNKIIVNSELLIFLNCIILTVVCLVRVVKLIFNKSVKSLIEELSKLIISVLLLLTAMAIDQNTLIYIT